MALRVGPIDVLHKDSTRPDGPGVNDSHYLEPDPEPRSRLLLKGHRRTAQNRDLGANTIWDQEVPLVMRDGTILRADVFRPEGDDKFPAIVAWSPYGNSGRGFFHLDVIPGRVGVPPSALSGYEK